MTTEKSQFSLTQHRLLVEKLPSPAQVADVWFNDAKITIDKDVNLTIRIYRPKTKKTLYPTIFYIPGTGFIARSHTIPHALCSHLAQESKCQVIMINHRLAPEHPCPTPINDCNDAVVYLLENAENFSINKKQTGIAGYSSGGNIAAITAIHLKQREHKFVFQFLIGPLVDLSCSLQDYKYFSEQDKTISEQFLSCLINLYCPPHLSRKDPNISPYWNQRAIFKGLPRTFIFAGWYDRLRSQAHAYKLKLSENEVHSQLVLFKEQDHAFMWKELSAIELGSKIIRETFSPYIPKKISYPPNHFFSSKAPKMYYPDSLSDQIGKVEQEEKISMHSKL